MATSALITGASGLLGTWVLRHWEGVGTAPLPVRGADVDLLAPGAAAELVARTEPTHVVHLAWCASGRDDYRTSDDNARWVDATLELVDAARASGSVVWVTGTVVDEAVDAPDAYSRAKAQLKEALAPAIEEGSVGWLRPYYVFDDEQRRPGVVELAASARQRDEPVVLRHPFHAHDFVHASDVGRAIVLAVANGLSGQVPIGSGRLHTVAELVSAMGAAWAGDDEQPPQDLTHAGEIADITRLTDLGWAPTKTEEFFSHE